MEFTITAQSIISTAALVSAIIVILKQYNKGYDLIKHQTEQDKRMDKIDKHMDDIDAGQTVIMKALLGVLNGQIEQGCNGNTHAARDEIQAYLLGKGEHHD